MQVKPAESSSRKIWFEVRGLTLLSKRRDSDRPNSTEVFEVQGHL